MNRGSVDGILARSIDAVRVNDCQRRSAPDGRVVWVKRRRTFMDAIILAGNAFLATSNSRIQMFASCERWRRHETASFRLLHGDAVRCGPEGRRAVWFEELPGQSLRRLSDLRALHTNALRAAGREFARAHVLTFPPTLAPWSHGDPHLANVLFDASTGRARLIDFETAHEPRLPADERHADDLLTFLLELAARSEESAWRPNAAAFLDAYEPAAATRQSLLARLNVPGGLERVLWQTRTEYMATSVLDARLAELRQLVSGRVRCHDSLLSFS